MLHKKYLYLILFSLIVIGQVFGQNNTNSPYSKLGLGEFTIMGFGRNLAMGGTGLALKSNTSINPLNPASYVGIDSLMTIMELGFHGNYTTLKTSLGSNSDYNANFSYLAFGFHIKDYWGMSFGILPYTNIGYSINVTEEVDGSDIYYKTTNEGSGGLSNIYWGNGFRLGKTTAVGLNISYLFGPKENEESYDFDDDYDYNIYVYNKNSYHGWKFNLGLQQDIKITPTQILTLAATASLPGKLKYKNDRLVTMYYPDYGYAYTDTLDYEEGSRKSTDFGMNFGIGMAYSIKKSWNIAADYRLDRWSTMADDNIYADLIDNHIFTLGVEFNPQKNKFSSGVTYRVGFNHQSGYFEVKDTPIESYTFSGGAEFMIRRIRMNLYGQYINMGTLSHGLIKDNTIRIGLNFCILDTWFIQRKYN